MGRFMPQVFRALWHAVRRRGLCKNMARCVLLALKMHPTFAATTAFYQSLGSNRVYTWSRIYNWSGLFGTELTASETEYHWTRMMRVK